MVILLILIHGLLSTLHAERTMRYKIVCFTRQHFARAFIDAETSRSLFVKISRIFSSSLCAYPFLKCILKAEPVSRDLNTSEKFNSLGKFTTDRHIPRKYPPISAIKVSAAPKSVLFEPFWSQNGYKL